MLEGFPNPEQIIVRCTKCMWLIFFAKTRAGDKFNCPACGEGGSVPVEQPPPDSVDDLQRGQARLFVTLRGMVAGYFPAIQILAISDDRCCSKCREWNKRIIMRADARVGMLPPNPECENEDDGCRCTTSLLSQVSLQEKRAKGE